MKEIWNDSTTMEKVEILVMYGLLVGVAALAIVSTVLIHLKYEG